MANRMWNFSLRKKNHVVELKHSYWTGNTKVYLDGSLVSKGNTFWNMGGEFPFLVDEHNCLVVIRSKGAASSIYEYDLALDDISITTGKSIGRFVKMPKWGWIFFVLCLSVSIIGLGGIIPMLLGLGGASIINKIARDNTKTVGLRIALSAGITFVAWILFLALSLWVTIQRIGG
jgi:hypothetical protein